MKQTGSMDASEADESPPDAGGGERDLWCAVLHRLIDDALDTSRHAGARPTQDAERRRHQQAARRWLGTRDFVIVCHLAGLDPQAVADRVRPKLAEAE